MNRSLIRGLSVTAASALLTFGAVAVGPDLIDRPAPAEQAGAPVGPGRVRAGRIDTGDLHTCAVLDDTSLRCWGAGGFGQLGYGNTDTIGDDELPGGPVDVGAGRTVGAVSAGADHTCAVLDDASVRCWGAGGFGQLGYGNTDTIGDGEAPSSTGPVDLGAGRTALAVTAGANHTCAVLDDGSVRCWGLGDLGQLGSATTETIGDNETPATVGPVDLGAGRTATAVTAGANHTCALLDDATVRCWGAGGSGRLGYGSNDDIGDDETPASAGAVDLGAGRTAVAIGAGSLHTCAVLDDASLRCWGAGFGGQLGYGNVESIGDEVGETPASAGPVDIGVGRTATAIAAGADHTCAVLDDASVRCWGNGFSGQLGYGNSDTIGVFDTPGDAGPVDLGAGRTAVAIAAGGVHTCALLDDATARCWGDGTDGQLGYGNNDDIGDDEAPGSAGPVVLVPEPPPVHQPPPHQPPPPPPGSSSGDGFVPVPPVRVLDTRIGLGASGPLAAEATLALSVPGVPADATAVVVNVTVTEPDRDGFLTVWPCGPARPLVSNLNFATGENRANLVVATRGAGGQICFGGNAATHVVADLAGWYEPADATNSRYNPLAPERLVDTRTSTPLTPASPLTVTVVGGPVPADASAVMLNVTAVEPASAGFLTVWPCDQAQPVVSNVNYTAGQIVPNAAAVKTSAAGTVCVATFAPTDVVVDRVGWFGATGDLYQPFDPVRVLDTRTGVGAATGKVAAEATLALTVPGLPAGASGVIVNVTATEPGGDGFVTVWPCGQPRPLASTLNFVAGQLAVPNLAAVALGPGQRSACPATPPPTSSPTSPAPTTPDL